MVFFNYSTMQMHAKVVYYGPGLCGKTTNLQYIYDHTGNDSRGEMVSLATETDRTLFFDLLPIDVGKIAGFTTRIQLYTVPGQVFYNTTRKLVLKGVDGVVFVADSQRPMLNANVESFENLEENLAEMGLDLETIPVVLQYNKRDLPNILSVEELDESLNKGGWPAVEASALNGDGVFETLKTISKATLIALKNRMTKGRGESTSKPKPAAAPGRPMPAAPPPRKSGSPMPAAPPPKGDQAAKAETETEQTKTPAAAEAKAKEAEPPAAVAPVEKAAAAAESVSEAKASAGELESVEIDPEVAAAAGLKTTGTAVGMDPTTGDAAKPDAAKPEAQKAEEAEKVEELAIEAPPELEPVEFETDDPEPAAPAQSVPEPAPSEPAAPELAAPEPAAPEPAAPEPAAPEAVSPKPTASEQAAPAKTTPEPAQAAPEPATPARTAPEPAAPPAAKTAASKAATAAPAPEPSKAQPKPAPAASPPGRKKKRKSGGIDVLAELEELRRQTLDPKAAKAAQVNGQQEVRRELDLALGDSLRRARRFSLTLQVEDDEHRALLDEARKLTVDIERPGDIERLMLRLHIALRSSAG